MLKVALINEIFPVKHSVLSVNHLQWLQYKDTKTSGKFSEAPHRWRYELQVAHEIFWSYCGTDTPDW